MNSVLMTSRFDRNIECPYHVPHLGCFEIAALTVHIYDVYMAVHISVRQFGEWHVPQCLYIPPPPVV